MRTWMAGAAAVALAAGLTGCGGGTDDKAGGCTDGTFAWSGVRHTEKVTHLAEPITIEKRTASYKADLDVIDTVVYHQTISPRPEGASSSDVLASLGTYLKADEPLGGGRGQVDTRIGAGYEEGTGLEKGSYYAWSYLNLVDADFTYTCGDGEPVKGHVRTWDKTGSDFRSCAEKAPSESGREAAARRCPTGSKAAEAA
ncbi:hypothetical protein OG866_15345 [Streptomyces sp. NBC_00663]|uniref:hypothetical protein n=1 Tax=Streptomyces sp. NBC_00663 TaxID=2975801 RepID=UPI002E35A821|nr:hypothetical protein [Streptomyces sp. NBC_00663]